MLVHNCSRRPMRSPAGPITCKMSFTRRLRSRSHPSYPACRRCRTSWRICCCGRVLRTAILKSKTVPNHDEWNVSDMAPIPVAPPTPGHRVTDSLVHKQKLIESALDNYTQFSSDCPDTLRDAIRYSLLTPGKRLRT